MRVLREHLSRPLERNLVLAATARCACGAELAYEPAAAQTPAAQAWDCSALMLGRADLNVTHTTRAAA